MPDTPTDVLVAGYQDVAAANKDFATHEDEKALHQHHSQQEVAAGIHG